MTPAASTAQQVSITLGGPPVLEKSRAPAAAHGSEPRLVPHHEAHRSPDPAARLTAQALSTVSGLVPCRLALFSSITRRMRLGDTVVLEHAAHSGPSIGAEFYRARGHADDPFAPERAVRTGASLLTVEDAGGALRLAKSPYGWRLYRAGLEHQVTLFLRAAGAVAGMIALFRAQGAPTFDRNEIRILRQLQPLLELAHARDFGTAAADLSATLPELTRREAEVAALVALGASNAEIATALNVEQSTVKTHLTQIYAKFGLRSRTQLALRLKADGLPNRDQVGSVK